MLYINQMSTEPAPHAIKFSIEETKENLKSKLSQSLLNLIELSKSTVRSSESQELFRQCIKSFALNESLIESSSDKLNKIEIISGILNYQVQTLEASCDQLKEITNQLTSARTRKNAS
jgi:hypothetical protein